VVKSRLFNASKARRWIVDSSEVVGGWGEGVDDDGGKERGVREESVLNRWGRERVWRRCESVTGVLIETLGAATVLPVVSSS